MIILQSTFEPVSIIPGRQPFLKADIEKFLNSVLLNWQSNPADIDRYRIAASIFRKYAMSEVLTPVEGELAQGIYDTTINVLLETLQSLSSTHSSSEVEVMLVTIVLFQHVGKFPVKLTPVLCKSLMGYSSVSSLSGALVSKIISVSDFSYTNRSFFFDIAGRVQETAVAEKKNCLTGRSLSRVGNRIVSENGEEIIDLSGSLGNSFNADVDIISSDLNNIIPLPSTMIGAASNKRKRKTQEFNFDEDLGLALLNDLSR